MRNAAQTIKETTFNQSESLKDRTCEKKRRKKESVKKQLTGCLQLINWMAE